MKLGALHVTRWGRGVRSPATRSRARFQINVENRRVTDDLVLHQIRRVVSPHGAADALLDRSRVRNLTLPLETERRRWLHSFSGRVCARACSRRWWPAFFSLRRRSRSRISRRSERAASFSAHFFARRKSKRPGARHRRRPTTAPAKGSAAFFMRARWMRLL